MGETEIALLKDFSGEMVGKSRIIDSEHIQLNFYQKGDDWPMVSITLSQENLEHLLSRLCAYQDLEMEAETGEFDPLR